MKRKNKGFLPKREKNSAGFTLLEITIVIVVITIMFSIFLVNYRGAEKEFALSRSAHKLAQDIRRVQEMAIASQTTPPDFVDPNPTFPEGGYGIHLKKDDNFYIIFADCDDGNDYDPYGVDGRSCKDANPNLGESVNDEKILEGFLEEGIYISKISEVEVSPPTETEIDEVVITFFPPEPETTIIIDGSSKAEAVITLTFDNVHKKTVRINKAGLIEIQ